MLLVISPAKTLDYQSPLPITDYSQPDFLPQAAQLIKRAQQYTQAELMQLMDISESLAELNMARYRDWHAPFTPDNARQAVLAFKGDVYEGLAAHSFSANDFQFAQQHLRILSGLYGVLRPLDLMQPYRLEMGRAINTEQGNNLYQFWGSQITESLNQQLARLQSNTLINLASAEYFKSVKTKQLQGEVITPEFREYKNGQYKMLGVYAKRARGLLSRYIIQQRLDNPEDIKHFNVEGYQFNATLSSHNTWVFSRG